MSPVRARRTYAPLLLALGTAVIVRLAFSQTTDKQPSFEVISIRPRSDAGGPAQRPTTTPTGYRSIGLPLIAIFQTAWAPPNQPGVLRGDLIAGAPSWLLEDRYDVETKVNEADLANWQNPAMTQSMLHAMLRSMLAERCKAEVHHETRSAPVYDLVLAKGGPKFKPAATTNQQELTQKPGGGGMMIGTGVRAIPGPDGIGYYGISMSVVTQTILPGLVGRPVLDKTGLTGFFDLTIPDLAVRSTRAESGDEQSIFSALPEALGLRLESAKGQVEMLVLDRVERPTSN